MGRAARKATEAARPPIDDRGAHRADLAEDLAMIARPFGRSTVSADPTDPVGAAVIAAIDAIDVDSVGSATAGVAAFDAARVGVFTVDQPREAGALEDETGVVDVPLARLAIHPDNVRRTGRKGKVDDLIASIAARGLLQNLLVVADPAKPGYWLVKAGGRRLRALEALARAGTIDWGCPVPVRILGDHEHAAEASLAENLHRVALNAADEILAFKGFVSPVEGGAGELPAEIARRFGVTERHVVGRLRLAGLHDKVMNALRDGSISLDAAQAYASVDDPDLQAAVFTESYSRNMPAEIRRAMQRGGVRPDDAAARLIGRDAYLAAGGRVDADLFSDASDELWLDKALVARLAAEALHAGAVALQAKFGFGKMLIAETNWGQPADGDIAGLTEYGRTLDWTQLAAGARSQLAVVAMIASDGRVVLFRTAWLVSGEMLVATEAERFPVKPALDDDVRDFPAGGDPDGLDDGEGLDDAAPVTAAPIAAVAEESAALSQRMQDELAMRRRDVLRLCLADNYALAADVAAFVLADRFVGPKSWGVVAHGSSIRTNEINEPISGLTWTDDLGEHLAAQHASLPDDWAAVADPAARFAAFRALQPAQRSAWLAWATAASLTAWENNFTRAPAALHAAIGAAMVPMPPQPAMYWRPTAANYFDRVAKARCLAMMAEVGLPAVEAKDAPWAKWKRAKLAEECAKLADGDASGFGLGGCGSDKLRRWGAAGAMWLPREMMVGGGE